MAYSFCVSYVILYLINLVPFMKLRVDEKWEMDGLDHSSMGEYTFEALTEKEAKLNLEEYLGASWEDGQGGVHSM